MKRILFSFVLLLGFISIKAQEPVIEFSGEIYFIPASMTKAGAPLMYTKNDSKLTLYDGDLNIIQTFDAKEGSFEYEERYVHQTRKLDPETQELLSEWVVTDDQTVKNTYTPWVSGFEIYSDDNAYHSRNVYLTQTLFDDDEEFELIREKYEVIPINTKSEDYYKSHTSGSGNVISENSDEILSKYGAESYHTEWDEELNKPIIILEKTDRYGGLFGLGKEIVSMNGSLKGTFSSYSSSGFAYYYRGNLYVKGNSKSGNGYGLYLLNTSKNNSSQSSDNGDLNNDGVINAADVVRLTDIIMNK